MELTREEFELILTQKLEQFPTKHDIEQQLSTQSQDLKVMPRVCKQNLARMVADGFEDMRERLDVREPIIEFEHKFTKLEEALHIKL
jgi:hypothetical protein